MPETVTWHPPQGGFFVGLFFEKKLPGAALTQAALRHGLALLNGDTFFATTPAPAFIRLPFPGLAHPELAELTTRLGALVSEIQALPGVP